MSRVTDGTVQTQDEANQIWNAIKTVPEWRDEGVADIEAVGSPAASSAAAGLTT